MKIEGERTRPRVHRLTPRRTDWIESHEFVARALPGKNRVAISFPDTVVTVSLQEKERVSRN